MTIFNYKKLHKNWIIVALNFVLVKYTEGYIRNITWKNEGERTKTFREIFAPRCIFNENNFCWKRISMLFLDSFNKLSIR